MAAAEKLTFPGASGAMLAARLQRPAGVVKAYALFAHCFTCSKDLRPAKRICDALTARGVAVLRFDFTGLGESEGDFADTDFSSNVEDLVAAADFLRERYGPPKLLIGHSLGGAAVVVAAQRIPEALAVATIGAPSETQHLRQRLVRKAPELEARGEAEVTLGGRPFRIKQQLLEDLSEQNVRSAARALRRALVLFHSPFDEVVGIDHARRLYQSAKHPKSFISLPQADHLLIEHLRDASYIGEVLGSWATRYIDELVQQEVETDSDQRVVVTGGAGYAQDIVAGRHRLRADEPERVGGTDTGPSPYGLLLAGLGACTSMTLRMYADRKGWPLEQVRVQLEHHKIHARDCEDCESDSGRIDVIERVVEVTGDLDDAQRERLHEIANKCPVHRTLHSEVKVRSRLLGKEG